MNTWIFEGVHLTCIEFMRTLIESTRILTYFVRCSSNMKLFIYLNLISYNFQIEFEPSSKTLTQKQVIWLLLFFFLLFKCMFSHACGIMFPVWSGGVQAFPKGSPLTLDVSKVIANLQEQGKIESIKDKWFKKDAGCKRDPATTSISFNSLWGLFLLVGVSSAFALLVHAAMFFYQNRHLLILPDPNASLWQKLCKIVTFTL